VFSDYTASRVNRLEQGETPARAAVPTQTGMIQVSGDRRVNYGLCYLKQDSTGTSITAEAALTVISAGRYGCNLFVTGARKDIIIRGGLQYRSQGLSSKMTCCSR